MAIDTANQALIKKLMRTIVFAYAIAVLSVVADQSQLHFSQDVATFFRKLIPSLSAAPLETQNAFIHHFGLSAILSPAVAAYFLLGDPLRARLLRAITVEQRTSVKKMAFLYLLGLPTILAILFFSLNASSYGFMPERVTAGAQFVQVLAKSWVALCIFAPIVSVGLWLLLYVLFVPVLGILAKE